MRTRNFTYIAKNADIEKIQSIECQYHIYGHYEENDIGGYIRFSSAKTLSAAKKCIGYEVNIIEQEKINDKIQNILQAEQIWEKGEKLKRGRRYPSESIVALDETQCSVEINKENEENKKIQLQLLELLQHIKEIGSLPPQTNLPVKITNYVVHLNTNMKNAYTFEDLILLFVFTSDDVILYEKNGFIHTIFTIFLRILSKYTIENRPIHTSDENRHNIYLHTKEGWIKEIPNESPLFDKIINAFTHKFHQQMIREYKDISTTDKRFEYASRYSGDTTTYAEKNKIKFIKKISNYLHLQ